MDEVKEQDRASLIVAAKKPGMAFRNHKRGSEEVTSIGGSENNMANKG